MMIKNYFNLSSLLGFAFCIIINPFSAQNCTWMKGSNGLDQIGRYGQAGVPASTNTPGARVTSTTWKDAAGNLWLFGGLGFDGSGYNDYLNDLWKYTISTNEWTWMKGDSVAYVDGVYGTMGVPANANTPGSRIGASYWTDLAGNFWLFGGLGLDGASGDGELNDLWKYTVTTNQWTWIRGSNTCRQPANYGIQGLAAPGNDPGAGYMGTSWVDASGNFWLFGGEGQDANTYGDLDDLWMYSPASNEWTWVKGSGIADQAGAYGTQAVPALANNPGGRYGSLGWTDATGNLWLHGGFGWDASSSTPDFLNDLWRYTPSTNEWTWLKGSSFVSQPGVYGTQGVASAANVPGARGGQMTWTDQNTGDFYLFGGYGYFNSPISSDDMNDLWKYSPPSNQWTWLKGNTSIAQNGTYGTQGLPAPQNIPGSRSFIAGWRDNSNNFWLFGGEGVASTTLSSGSLNDLWKISNCLAPTLTLSAGRTTICRGESGVLSVSGASTYTWNTSQTTASISVSPTLTTTYTVTGTDATGCSKTSTLTQVVSGCSGLAQNAEIEHGILLYPNPNKGTFTLKSPFTGDHAKLLIFNALGQKVLESTLPAEEAEIRTDLQKGIYYYTLINDSVKVSSGKFMVD